MESFRRGLATLLALSLVLAATGVAVADDLAIDGDTLDSSVNINITDCSVAHNDVAGSAVLSHSNTGSNPKHFLSKSLGGSATWTEDVDAAGDTAGITVTGSGGALPDGTWGPGSTTTRSLSTDVPAGIASGTYKVAVKVEGPSSDTNNPTITRVAGFNIVVDCATPDPDPTPDPTPADSDGDGIPDATDNCPNAVNPLQENADGDALGDACDTNSYPPVLGTAAVDASGNEGSLLSAYGSFTDQDGNDTLTLSVPSGTAGTFTDNADGTWSWSYRPGDNVASTAITVTASDNEHTNANDTFNYEAANVTPSKTITSFSFNNYTGLAQASVSFSDPGWLDVVSADFSGINDPATTTAGPGSSPGPLTGTFSTSQTFTGCVTDAITVRVSDDDGDYFDHTFAAADTLGVYSRSFRAPIKEGMRNIAKLGNVIPVKLAVLDCLGNPVQGLTLSIRLVKGNTTDETEEGAVVIDATSVSGADTTNVMRYQADGGFYMYNLATKGLATGVPFTILIKDGTQLIADAVIELKK